MFSKLQHEINVTQHVGLYGLLLALLSDQRLVDMRDHTCGGRKTPRITHQGGGKNEFSHPQTRCLPPPAMVALIKESSSSSPLMASCKWRGVIRFTFRSLDAFPANSSTLKEGQSLVGQKPGGGGAATAGTERYLRGEILEDGRAVHGRRGTHPAVAGGSGLEVSVNTPHRELGEEGFSSNMLTFGGGCHKCRCRGDDKHFARVVGARARGGNERAATQTCSPALWEREIAFVLVLPESFPAFPAAWKTRLR